MRDRYRALELSSLIWPSDLVIPSRRFRLFVAADVSALRVEKISDFADRALENGMVYFSAWGPGCGKFHDIVDEITVDDELGDRKFVGPNDRDTIMTTWHERDMLDEALDFFVKFACPTDGFAPDSEYWLMVSVSNEKWARTIRQRLQSP